MMSGFIENWMYKTAAQRWEEEMISARLKDNHGLPTVWYASMNILLGMIPRKGIVFREGFVPYSIHCGSKSGGILAAVWLSDSVMGNISYREMTYAIPLRREGSEVVTMNNGQSRSHLAALAAYASEHADAQYIGSMYVNQGLKKVGANTSDLDQVVTWGTDAGLPKLACHNMSWKGDRYGFKFQATDPLPGRGLRMHANLNWQRYGRVVNPFRIAQVFGSGMFDGFSKPTKFTLHGNETSVHGQSVAYAPRMYVAKKSSPYGSTIIDHQAGPQDFTPLAEIVIPRFMGGFTSVIS